MSHLFSKLFWEIKWESFKTRMSNISFKIWEIGSDIYDAIYYFSLSDIPDGIERAYIWTKAYLAKQICYCCRHKLHTKAPKDLEIFLRVCCDCRAKIEYYITEPDCVLCSSKFYNNSTYKQKRIQRKRVKIAIMLNPRLKDEIEWVRDLGKTN